MLLFRHSIKIFIVISQNFNISTSLKKYKVLGRFWNRSSKGLKAWLFWPIVSEVYKLILLCLNVEHYLLHWAELFSHKSLPGFGIRCWTLLESSGEYRTDVSGYQRHRVLIASASRCLLSHTNTPPTWHLWYPWHKSFGKSTFFFFFFFDKVQFVCFTHSFDFRTTTGLCKRQLAIFV